jgi:hypothetical protein
LHFIRIVVLCIAAAVAYGVVHDQVTARVCVEYFTVGHPRLIASESPLVLGLFWGVVATWWVGLPLGIALGLAARTGGRPKLDAADLLRPLRRLLVLMLACALVAGIAGFVSAELGQVALPRGLAARIDPARHARFIADWWAHTTSYAVGIVGGVALAIRTFRRRRVQARSM